MHVTSEPTIMYAGTPVALLSTVNDDGSANLAPMSSAFWLDGAAYSQLEAVLEIEHSLDPGGTMQDFMVTF